MPYGSVTVTSTPTLIVGANCKRQELTLINSSATTDIFVGPDASVSTANGLPLYAQQRNDHWKGPGGSYLGDFYAVCASGSADVRFWEVER